MPHDAEYFLDPQEVATGNNWWCERPEGDELFIDIDSPERYALFEAHLKILRQTEMAMVTRNAKSFTPGHRHVVVQLTRRLKPYERTAYELALGSDPKRGLLGLHAIREGRAHDASVFFEPKVASCVPS